MKKTKEIHLSTIRERKQCAVGCNIMLRFYLCVCVSLFFFRLIPSSVYSINSNYNLLKIYLNRFGEKSKREREREKTKRQQTNF